MIFCFASASLSQLSRSSEVGANRGIFTFISLPPKISKYRLLPAVMCGVDLYSPRKVGSVDLQLSQYCSRRGDEEPLNFNT